MRCRRCCLLASARKAVTFKAVFMDTFQRIVISGEDASAVLESQAKTLQGIMDESKAPCWAPDRRATACKVK